MWLVITGLRTSPEWESYEKRDGKKCGKRILNKLKIGSKVCHIKEKHMAILQLEGFRADIRVGF